MTQDLCRAEFEKWYSDNAISPKNKYAKQYFEESAYMIWQACYERFAKPDTEHNPNVRNVHNVHNVHNHAASYETVTNCDMATSECSATNPADNSQWSISDPTFYF